MDYLVVALPERSPYLATAFPDGRTPLEHMVARVERLRTLLSHRNRSQNHQVVVVERHAQPEISRLIPEEWRRILVSETPEADAPGDSPGPALSDADGDADVGDAEEASGAQVLRRLDAELEEHGGTVVWLAADAPFFDVELTAYLLKLHRQAWCDYTFADGFPTGYSGEILQRDVLPPLAELAAAGSVPWTRTLLFDALSRDINAFDVETEAAAEDFALLRLSLTVDSRDGYLLCRRLVERGVTDPTAAPREIPDPAHERYRHEDLPLLATLRDETTLRRTVPRYVQVQITTEMNQTPAYTPWADTRWRPDPPGRGTHMSASSWETLLGALVDVSPEVIVAVGYRGEPALHPQWNSLVGSAASIRTRHPSLCLYVETSGIGWSAGAREALKEPVVAAVIVEMDAVKPDQYAAVRGEGFEEATALVEWARREIPDKLHVQATRMKDNEWELHEFFTHWDGTDGARPLIQKYNSFAGRLPDRRVVDLSPLRRVPCWHLQRDMTVLVNGDVPRCFQDLDGEGMRGNVFSEAITTVWEAGEAEFAAHGRAAYPEMCGRCDEYYTFNA